MCGNLSVESICAIKVAFTGDFNLPPSFDFNPVETVRIFFVKAYKAGLMISVLSPFESEVVKLTDTPLIIETFESAVKTIFVTV